MRIPAKGRRPDEILADLEARKAADLPWRDGRTWAYVYDPGAEAEDLIHRAYALYLGENGLDPTVFPSALALENDVVGMARDHLRGDERTVGSFTSGGTESLILAVKTARDWAREHRPGVRRPEVLLPETGHAAFHKAAHYLDVGIRTVPVDPRTFRADPAATRAAIGANTVLLVGSAVSYAHGVVDPIRELGEIALERGLLLHVDACMGGFLLPYFRRLGVAVPDFELHVPGVTSISMDLHKYAFAAKGASVLLHRDAALRRHQIYACADWSGYTVVNPTIQSTKSVGPVAAAWAVLHHFGDEGYLAIARSVLEATRRIRRGIGAIPGLRVLGDPEMNLVAFASDDVDVFHLVDAMRDRGWYVQPQLSRGPSPANVHLSVNPASVRHVDALLADLEDAVRGLRESPPADASAALRAALAGVDPGRRPGPGEVAGLLAAAGASGSSLPGHMAPIHQALDALPVGFREALLVEYANELFRPTGD